MAETRLFALNSENRHRHLEQAETCANAFCAQIEKYIQYRINRDKANPETSEGITRAKALIQHIKLELVQKRQFTGQQLLWIMFDYATRDRGCWPLKTSSLLRDYLLNYLCRYLDVSELQFSTCIRLREEDNLKVSDLPVTLPTMFNPRRASEPFEFAVDFLIKEGLAKTTQPEVPDIENGYSRQLLATLDHYIAWATPKWFREEGINRAKNIKTLITSEWLPYEKLNETQLMWRILEQIDLERENNYGIFGTSTDCRMMVLKGLCEYLGISAEVNARLKIEVNRHYTQKVGFFYLDRMEDDFEKEKRVCLNAIKTALIARSNQSIQHSNIPKKR